MPHQDLEHASRLPYISSYSFSQLGAKGASEYLAKFLDTIPSRMKFLAKNIRNTPGFKDWKPDRDIESLLRLKDWLAAVAKLGEPTKEQRAHILASIPAKLKTRIDISTPVPTLETELIARDVGTYCALMVADKLPTTWGYIEKPKDSVQLWMPALFYEPRTRISGSFCPLSVGTVLAIRAAEDDLSSEWLIDAYNLWTAELPPQPAIRLSRAKHKLVPQTIKRTKGKAKQR